MSKPLTIDNYDIKVHERYASDQQVLDRTYTIDTTIHPHFEIPVNGSTVSSKWEELFETDIHHHPWATFSPPAEYSSLRNRIFSYALSASFDWHDLEKEEEREEEEKENERMKKYKTQIQQKKSKSIPLAILEKDRSALLNLLDSIQMLNNFLKEVHAKKLQYQKG